MFKVMKGFQETFLLILKDFEYYQKAETFEVFQSF